MLKLGILVVVLACAGIASAQWTPMKQCKKLKEREAVATTQPTDPTVEIAALKSVHRGSGQTD